MGKHSHIFKYVMLIYAFAFVTALTLDTDRGISAWNPGADISIKQAERSLSQKLGRAHVKEAVGIMPKPTPTLDKNI